MGKLNPTAGLYLAFDNSPTTSTLGNEPDLIDGNLTVSAAGSAGSNRAFGLDFGSPKKPNEFKLYDNHATPNGFWSTPQADIYYSADNATWTFQETINPSSGDRVSNVTTITPTSPNTARYVKLVTSGNWEPQSEAGNIFPTELEAFATGSNMAQWLHFKIGEENRGLHVPNGFQNGFIGQYPLLDAKVIGSDTARSFLSSAIGSLSSFYPKMNITELVALFAKIPLESELRQYSFNEISEEKNRAQFNLLSMHDPLTMAQFPVMSLEDFNLWQRYAVNLLEDMQTKKQNISWDISLDGISIKNKVKEIRILRRESEVINQVEITLLDQRLWQSADPFIKTGEERIIITIEGTVFKFLLEDRERSETFNSPGFSLWGRQKPAILGDGFSARIQASYENMWASAIAADLSGSISLTWNAQDYWVPSFSMDGNPLEGIIELAEAIGAIARTNPDGTLTVRAKFPVRPKALNSSSPFKELDRGDILSLDLSEEEAAHSAVTINVHQITEETDYSMESDKSCVKPGQSATVKIYSSKWGQAYDLCVTQGRAPLDSNYLTGRAVKIGTGIIEDIEETISLENGKGTLSRSLFEIISYTLNGCGNSGNTLDYQIGSKEVSVANDYCSSLTIKYRTKHDLWEVYSDVEADILACISLDEASITPVKIIMGKGEREGDEIDNSLIFTQNQARKIGEAFLDDHFYKKKKYSLEIPYAGIEDGKVAAVNDDRYNVYETGIVRASDILITMEKTARIKETIEIHTYEKDHRL